MKLGETYPDILFEILKGDLSSVWISIEQRQQPIIPGSFRFVSIEINFNIIS